MRWDPETNQMFRFPTPRYPGGPLDDLVSAFAEDRQGNVWMGLFDRRRCIDMTATGSVHFKKSDGVPGGTIHSLLVDENGLWVASNGGGLGRIENPSDEHPQIEVYNTARGMASNSILCRDQRQAGADLRWNRQGRRSTGPENRAHPALFGRRRIGAWRDEIGVPGPYRQLFGSRPRRACRD